MPHGGPAAQDVIGFDYMAQALASRGYLVVQPQFRGSTGFGQEHYKAGWGQWGKAMQDDLTDGVNFFVKKGYADPARVCIVGASYGGYAALAGAAFTPDLYQCAVSIAGVSHLPKMLKADKSRYGKKAGYWIIGIAVF
jgi:Dipeptidyl aminopeptidases/acylaminoacyl-peptidases